MNGGQSSEQIEVFFDGGCPLCRREINMLRGWDRHGRIRFTDIDEIDFTSSQFEKSHDELMAQMHGLLPDGTWVRGVEVFRRMYSAIGFGPLVAITRCPGLSQLLDFAYAIFARHRLTLTGRCKDGACAIDVGRNAGRSPDSSTNNR